MILGDLLAGFVRGLGDVLFGWLRQKQAAKDRARADTLDAAGLGEIDADIAEFEAEEAKRRAKESSGPLDWR